METTVKKYPDFPPEPVQLHKFAFGDNIRLKNRDGAVKRCVNGIDRNGYMVPSFPTLENNGVGIDYIPFSDEDRYEKVGIETDVFGEMDDKCSLNEDI